MDQPSTVYISHLLSGAYAGHIADPNFNWASILKIGMHRTEVEFLVGPPWWDNVYRTDGGKTSQIFYEEDRLAYFRHGGFAGQDKKYIFYATRLYNGLVVEWTIFERVTGHKITKAYESRDIHIIADALTGHLLQE